MATQTPYFGLSKPAGIEAAQVGPLNANFDILDTELWMSFVRAAINLAPIYDETSSYVEGDYCTELITVDQTVTGFHLYKCTTDTTDPAGTFDTNSWTEVDITSEMGHGGGGGGGHIYLDNSGNVMTQRTKAKFEGAYTTDNGINDITNVAVLRTMSTSDFAQLTEAEKQGFIYVYDETTGTDDKFQPVIYSLEEREIGVWTDGKPLYQKTVITPSGIDISVSSSSWTNTGIDVSSLNIEKIINSFGLSTDGTYQGTILAYVENDNLTVQTTRNGNGWVVSFTIQYTKTTDTAGSGQWTPQGVPTVHYSMDEHVIGTWIDGKTLYEKTVYCPNIVKGQDNIINHNISNLETTVKIWGRCEYNNSGEILPLPYISSQDGYFIILGNVTSTRFQVSPGNNFTSIENCYVTLQYTKTSS